MSGKCRAKMSLSRSTAQMAASKTTASRRNLRFQVLRFAAVTAVDFPVRIITGHRKTPFTAAHLRAQCVRYPSVKYQGRQTTQLCSVYLGGTTELAFLFTHLVAIVRSVMGWRCEIWLIFECNIFRYEYDMWKLEFCQIASRCTIRAEKKILVVIQRFVLCCLWGNKSESLRFVVSLPSCRRGSCHRPVNAM